MRQKNFLGPRHKAIFLCALGKVFVFCVGVVGLVALGACSTSTRRAEAQIAPNIKFELPSPQELGYSVDAEQLVTARYRDDTQLFEAHLTVSPQRVLVIGFDPFGRRVFTATLTDGTTTFEATPALPSGLQAGNILADVAIVYWPDGAIRRGLPNSAEVRTEDDSRSILVGGREIIRVDYDTPPERGWPKLARYRNEAFGYALDLQSTVTAK